MKLYLLIIATAMLWPFQVQAASKGRTLQYHPDGRDIVCVNGENRYTRALYGGYSDFRVETSDRPIFGTYRAKNHRHIRFRLHVNGQTVMLENTARCEARYQAGMRTYQLADPAFGKGTLSMTVLAMPDCDAAIWQIRGEGLPADATLECITCGIRQPKLNRAGDLNADPTGCFDPATDENHKQTVSIGIGQEAGYVFLKSEAKGDYLLTTPSQAEALSLWDRAMQHSEWLASRIVFDTPDPYINTLGSALMAAADGAWGGEVWMHGAVAWRMPLTGWRAGYLGDVLGLPDRAVTHFSAYANSQVKDVEPTIPHPAQDPEKGLTRAAKTWGTQMYSNGYICRNPNRDDIMHHYDMNLNYIDELLWHFQYDADTVYMRRMWPVLKRHLDWEKRNYDPDDDGLYDAYCCIWASDALYYNSGAVTHSSAYNYRGFALAARIAEILGEDPTYYRQEAEKTLKAMNEQLWLKHRGHWAEYKDFMGLKRTHDHAALWSIYTPIDCGAATEEMAFRATQYVDSCIPHIPVVMTEKSRKAPALYTLSTTDWLPYDWSINNVAAAEVMHMALAYFEAGRSEEGYRLVKANIMDQAYLGDSPGNFGQISYYDKARGELYRDFSDNTGISARTFIQGLYGIVPDALHGRCILRPGFPAEWKHASISTPYFKYSFRREGNKEIYEIEQNFAQPLQIVLRQNTGYGYVETLGTSEKKQTIIVSRAKRQTAPKPLLTAERFDGKAWGNGFDDVKTDRLCPVDISSRFNSQVSDIFKNFYLSPRSPYTTLQIPVHGIGEWCHPEMMATIDDAALRERVKDGLLTVGIGEGIPFMYPKTGRNIVYTSLWDNYPDKVSIALSGTASHAYLLMAGSTNHMQSHIDNGLITVTYTDGTTDELPLRNPHNWCPIEQDYYEDGLAFHAAQPRPYRIDFASAVVARELMPMGEHYGRPAATGVAASYFDRNFERGAGIILDMPLHPQKTLQSLTISTLSNDVVIGLMGITLQRPANVSTQKK